MKGNLNKARTLVIVLLAASLLGLSSPAIWAEVPSDRDAPPVESHVTRPALDVPDGELSLTAL